MSVAKETDKEKKPDVLIEKEVAEVGAVRFSFQYLLIPWFPDELNIANREIRPNSLIILFRGEKTPLSSMPVTIFLDLFLCAGYLFNAFD